MILLSSLFANGINHLSMSVAWLATTNRSSVPAMRDLTSDLPAYSSVLGASLTEMPIASSPAWVMVLFATVMMATYVGVAVERFHKTVAALCGAAVLIILSIALDLFEYPKIYDFLKEDLNIFGVIIGTGILVDVVGKSGLFHFISMWIVRLTGGQANRLFITLCLVTFVFVSVLTIVPAMLILSSLVLVICRALGYKPMPLLLSVAVCANSGAIATFASGLPNIMIGTAAGIPYVDFLKVSLPYAIVSLFVAIIGLRIFFRNDLPWKQSEADKAALKQQVEGFDPWAMVEDRGVLYRSAIILLTTVCGFALAQPLHVGMDFVAMVGATAALLFSGKGVEDAIGKVNWTVILFFMGLFVIIGCVKQTGALKWVAEQVVAVSDNRIELLVPLMGIFAAIASSIVDNIPVAATLIPIVQDVTGGPSGVPAEPLWWTLVICCNLGGNGTPIGSISCVIAIYALKKEAGVHVGWGTFMKLGGGIMFVQVVGAIFYVLWMHSQGRIPLLNV